MNDPSLLSKYLAGNASDEEVQRCETMLQESENLDDLICEIDGSPASDSLVETLRNLGNHCTKYNPNDSNPKSLVEQIQSLVASPPIDQDDFDRILSPAESSDEIGRIAHYRVIEFIAGGGMGLVFKAEDSKLNRLVCIKVLNPSLAKNRGAVARFAREAKAAAKLRNTRITTVLEFGEHKELPFLVMELLEGQSLRDKINAEGKLSPAIARKLTIQIAEGLRYAHERGYLHRDIKPENIWVTPEGDIKLLDFGLARAFQETTNLTQSGTILGTPTYMSPEQVRGKELDARSDLFSVGTVLFEMLTGESPFGKSNLFSTMMSVANDSLTFPETTASNGTPDDLKQVIQSLLQKSPDQRVASADQLIEALKSDDGRVPGLTTGTNNSGMNRISTGLLGAVAGACCLALAFLLYQLNDKGTLIVEADSSINVNIADEEVSIEDPQTGKKFKVTIGDHPLPSGVYQLQMKDESGQYTLSSEVIAIRRGEKQIVRVELKPASVSASTGEISNKEAVPDSKPKLSLANLPTLDAAALKRKLVIQPGDTLFRNALVSKPSKRPGVIGWSIEPAFNGATSTKINSDGSRIATRSRYDDNMVSIWNRDGQLTHLIPAQDKTQEIKWSPDPNIIAVIENGIRRKQITVWKLFDDHVEAIDVIPGSGLHVSWSPDGLLLSVQDYEEISFIDLSKGSLFAHPNFGIQAKLMSDHPWSQDGRYFATTVKEGVKIWDLKERKLLHVFTGKTDGQFLAKGNQIAVKENRKWEIWDLDSFVRVRTIEPEAGWLRFWPDPQFQKLVVVTDEGKMIVRDIETGETANCNLELDSIITARDPNTSKEKQLLWYLRSMKMNWAPGGRDFVCVIGRTETYVSNADRAQGNTAADLAKLQSIKSFARTYVPVGSGDQLHGFELLRDGESMVYHDELHLKPGGFSRFELADITYSPSTEVSIYKDSADYRVSPDGKMVAIVGSDIAAANGVMPKEWSADLGKVRLCSLDTGKLTKTLQTGFVDEMLWSPDSKSLIVSVIRSRESDPAAMFRGPAQAVIEKLDANNDGKLHISEAGRLRNEVVDKDEDGFFSKNELADYYANASKKRLRPGTVSKLKSFNELETKIINVKSGDEFTLQVNGAAGERNEEGKLCFQREHSSWSFAKPVLHDGQVVLPLFDASTYSNGSRIRRRSSNEMIHKDKLGFFDLKTGKLNEVIELNCQFEGNRLSVSEQMILIGLSSESRSSSIDSFIVFDRLKDDRGFVPTIGDTISPDLPIEKMLGLAQQRSRLTEGRPYLSQTHPFVAVSSKGKITVWKLDSRNSTFNVVEMISVSDSINRGLRKLSWHPTEPTVAWIEDGVAHCYRGDVDQRKSCDAIQFASGISATSDGWIVAGNSKMVLLDRDFKTRKTWLSTERFTRLENWGKFDQSVTADGKTLNSKSDANMRLIEMRENRIETKPMSSLKKAEN